MRILYFSTVNWKWIKQRPHFICEYLSKRELDITYFSITPFLKQKIFCGKLNKYLYIKDRFVLPYSSKINMIKKINMLYIKQILNEKYDVVVLTHPEQWDYLPRNLKVTSKIIYECMDNIPYFYEEDRRTLLKKQEERLCEIASKIITSSYFLKNKIIDEYSISQRKIEVIKNALDKSLKNECREQVRLRSPNLIYIGTISEWIDVDILSKYAQDNPDYTIYLIGPAGTKIKNRICKTNSNIIFLGSIKHEEVKEYIKSGEVMLIPFKINELIKGVDPVKLYEYLALNKPVITSYWMELDSYKNNELVYFYDTYDEFVLAIDKIKNDVINKRGINIDFIEENTWENRVECYIKILEKLCQ